MRGEETLCAHCRQPVVLINYALGPKWMHQHQGAAFQDGMYEFCRITTASPA